VALPGSEFGPLLATGTPRHRSRTALGVQAIRRIIYMYCKSRWWECFLKKYWGPSNIIYMCYRSLWWEYLLGPG
jgi:hypothetical protein